MCERIEKIERDRWKKEIYWIYLEHGEKISMYGDIVIKHNLKKGKEITRKQLEDWNRENEEKKSLEMALNYLSYRPRSRKEMIDYLLRKGVDSITIELTLKKLEEYGYIDDLGFASGWTKAKMNIKPMGKRMMARELYQKGISRDIIEKALEQVDETEEEQAALILAKKYIKRYEKLQGKERLYKIGQALARRGFEWELIQRVCNKLNIGQEEGE